MISVPYDVVKSARRASHAPMREGYAQLDPVKAMFARAIR